MSNRPAKTKGTKSVTTRAKKNRFRFFSQLFEELKKVHWPTRQETVRLSLLVLVVCGVMGAILGGLDFAFMRLITEFIGG